MKGPGNAQGHVTAAQLANGRACTLPMRRRFPDAEWVAAMPGWGLLDAQTRIPIDPVALITDQNIAMTPWEIHDMAVQIVRDQLEQKGYELMSWQGHPEVDPSIWFIGKSGRPEWVVVRSATFPSDRAERPGNWQAIAAGCAKMSPTGHFASVVLVSGDQSFASHDEAPVPLWRGRGMHARFTGLE